MDADNVITKECSVCGEVKLLTEFYRSKMGKNGRRSSCRACTGIVTGRPRRRPIPDDMEGKRFGKLVAICPVDVRGVGRKIQWLFRCDCGNEVMKPVTLVLGDNTRSCGCVHIRKDSNFNLAHREYKTGARTRGLSWELDVTIVRALFEGDCHYCGSPPSIVIDTRGGDRFVRNGIDRLDSAVGYTTNNCVSCCTRCNFMKSNIVVGEFVEGIKAIYEHMKLSDAV